MQSATESDALRTHTWRERDVRVLEHGSRERRAASAGLLRRKWVQDDQVGAVLSLLELLGEQAAPGHLVNQPRLAGALHLRDRRRELLGQGVA